MMTRMRWLVALSVVCLVVPSCVLAVPGDLDLSFDADGRVVTAIGGGQDAAVDVIQLPDGKLVVAGSADIGGLTGQDFAVVRYNVNGTIDSTFDGDGIATVDFGEGTDTAGALLRQPNGKLLLGGSAAGKDFGLARLNEDGSLDTTFGNNGIQTTDFGGTGDVINGLALQTDGSIVAVGQACDAGSGCSVRYIALARYDTNGSLDPSFGTGGTVITGASSFQVGTAVAIQSNGMILVAGYEGAASSSFFVARYAVDGSLDATFDSDGWRTFSVQNSSIAKALLVQPDSQIVIAGIANNEFDAEFALVRLNSDGSFDPSFGVGGTGIALIDLGVGADGANAAVMQPDGKLIAAGGAAGGTQFGLTRLNADGSPDLTFGTLGIVLTPFTGETYADGIVLQSDGKIVAVGRATDSNADFAVARYLNESPTPSPTPTFTPTAICPSTPLSGCRAPGRTSLRIRNHADDSRDKLSWKWTQGGETLMSALGDPRSTTNYALCIYDSGATPLVAAAAIAGGSSCGGVPCWIISGSTGFRYLDRLASHDGMLRLKLRSGAAGSAVVKVVGRGLALPDPVLPLTMPVTAQIRNSLGECWSSDFTAIPIRNDAELLKVKGP